MATGIKERLEGRMPRQQVTECAKQYVLNWHVLQKYGDVYKRQTFHFLPRPIVQGIARDGVLSLLPERMDESP